jgi:hypothetical protein
MWLPAVVKSEWELTFGQFPLRLDYGRSPHAYINQRLQIQLELLMMSGVPLEHVEPSVNGGIINSITSLHLVGYLS